MNQRRRLSLVLGFGTLITVAFAIATYTSRLNADLLAAVGQKNFPTVRRLLDQGADPNLCYTDAEWTFYRSNSDADTDDISRPTLWERITAPFQDMMHYSERHRKPLLLFAVLDNDSQIADALIEHGAKVNAADDDQMTPLMNACDTGNIALVRVLLKRGVNVNAPGENAGYLPLTCALCAHRWDADGNLQDAPISQRLLLVNLLLQAGADPRQKDSEGLTVLHYYRYHFDRVGKQDPLAALLIQHGAVWPETLPHWMLDQAENG